MPTETGRFHSATGVASYNGATEGDRSMFSDCASDGMDNTPAEKWTSPHSTIRQCTNNGDRKESPALGFRDRVFWVGE